MKQLLGRAKNSPFVRHNTVYFIGQFGVAVLNYLYYPALSRLLTKPDFGEVQALVSLFLQANIFLGVLTNVAVNIVANEDDVEKRNRVVYELEQLALIVAAGVLLIALIATPEIKHYLQFKSALPFAILGLSLITGVPLGLRGAYLRGRSSFGHMSITAALGALFKLLTSVVFVWIGWRTSGAIGGLVVAQVISLMYAGYRARQLGYHHPRGRFLRFPDLTVIRPQLPYTLLVLAVSLITTVLFSVDVIVVKHLFSPTVAGEYAGIATVGRIIYFLTGSIGLVLLSSVRVGKPADNRRVLIQSLLLQLGIGGSALIVFVLLPRLVIRLLLGGSYLTFAHLLPLLSLTLFIMATANLLLLYDMALRRYAAAMVALAGAVITVTAIFFHHASVMAVVQSLLVGAISLLVLWSASAGLRALRKSDRLAKPSIV